VMVRDSSVRLPTDNFRDFRQRRVLSACARTVVQRSSYEYVPLGAQACKKSVVSP